jgi:hypothetical protein
LFRIGGAMSAEGLITIGVQVVSAAVIAGMIWRAQGDHDRRLDTVEESSRDHEGRISNIEGRLEIALPARAGR